jgi:hypothetical protein
LKSYTEKSHTFPIARFTSCAIAWILHTTKSLKDIKLQGLFKLRGI